MIITGNQEFYMANCPRCKIKTRHYIYKMSRTKGVKLRCIVCGCFKENWHKLTKLEEVKQ